MILSFRMLLWLAGTATRSPRKSIPSYTASYLSFRSRGATVGAGVTSLLASPVE